MSEEDEDQRALIVQLSARIEALTNTVAVLAGGRATVASQPLSQLKKRWSEAHKTLASFLCDDARADLILSWAPEDGPYAGVPMSARDAMSLSASDIDMYRAWRYGQITVHDRPPRPATVNREVMVLKRILNFAVSRGTIPRNPILGLEEDAENNASEVVIEEEGFARILSAFGDDQMMRTFSMLAYDSGMRLSETLSCRSSWLDERRGFIHIPGVIAKNRTPRVTDYSARAQAEVEKLTEGIRSLRGDLLFVNHETSRLYGKRWISAKWTLAVERSGVTGRDGRRPTIHSMRRSWVTLMRRRGVAESVIMAKSGHRDHKVFRRYSIVADEDLSESRKRMEEGRQRDLCLLSEERRGPKSAAGTPSSASTPNEKIGTS